MSLSKTEALAIVERELEYALRLHPRPYASLHEAYGIMSEERKEFLDAIHANDDAHALVEAAQIAATAIRTLMHLGESHHHHGSKEDPRSAASSEGQEREI